MADFTKCRLDNLFTLTNLIIERNRKMKRAKKTDNRMRIKTALANEQIKNGRLIKQRGELLTIIRTIEDQAHRASLVQDRSVSIIKDVCKIIASECLDAIESIEKNKKDQ